MSDAQLSPARSALDAALVIAQRGIRDLVRVPAAFLPSVFVPLFFYVIYSAGIGPIASKAGFGAAEDYRGVVLATNARSLSLSAPSTAGVCDSMPIPSTKAGFLANSS